MMFVWAVTALLLGCWHAEASTAGFIKSPLSQMKLVNDSAELHCEVIGNPIPEVQWWFVEGAEPNESFSQLFDGAHNDRVKINATYIAHATSTIHLTGLSLDDSGTYECRASNDPDRNDLKTTPKIKWIRSQANIIVIETPAVDTSGEVTNKTSAVLTCNLNDTALSIKGSFWKQDGKVLEDSKSTSTSGTMTLKLDKITHVQSGKYECVYETDPQAKGTIEVKTLPHVAPYKDSEHGSERDRGVLTCVAHGYPLPTDWKWYKEDDKGAKVLINATNDRIEIKTTSNKTVLNIDNLNMETDAGLYVCEGTNEVGSHSKKIQLRVRSRLAALWPFIGIVAEVIILVTIIFIYEKRRKPDEINDDDDSGAAPLKSNATTNHKDKNVRQRNAN